MLRSEIQEKGSSVIEVGWIPGHIPGDWYRSKEKKEGYHPFTSYMMNKKWPLEEEFTNHMLRFQQVT